MRKLKLQMHVSIDGMAEAQGRPVFNWDDELRQYSIQNAAGVDGILLGRKTAASFIPHWKAVADDPSHVDFEIGTLITRTPKVVFSQTLQSSEWPNATIVNGEIVNSINDLKRQPGNDLLVYGGTSFVTSLIGHNLIDEYHLLVNPVLVGAGQPIYSNLADTSRLTLVTTRTFNCGTVLLCYKHAPGFDRPAL